MGPRNEYIFLAVKELNDSADIMTMSKDRTGWKLEMKNINGIWTFKAIYIIGFDHLVFRDEQWWPIEKIRKELIPILDSMKDVNKMDIPHVEIMKERCIDYLYKWNRK